MGPHFSFGRLWLFALFLSAVYARGETGSPLMVIGDAVNLRAANSDRVEVVGQVSRGRVLTAVGPADGDWIPVVPPDEVDLWIYADLVDAQRVVVNRAQIRAGAGLNYRVVGSLERDAPVTVRGRLGDWLRIAPPTGSRLWIHANYVQPAADPVVPPVSETVAPEVPDLSAHTETPTAVPDDLSSSDSPPVPVLPDPIFPRATETVPSHRQPEPLPFPPELRRMDPDLDRHQGERAQFSGVLRRSGWGFRRPAPFRLVSHDRSGRAVTVCYIIGAAETLPSLIGSPLRVEGTVFWVSGNPVPVLALDRLWRSE